MGLVATITALVLGLLVASAKGSYAAVIRVVKYLKLQPKKNLILQPN
jgi:hypothetical protein